EYVQNFKRQEAEGSRLQRELRGYLAAIKGMQDASKKLTESLHEVYEPDWYGREDVKMIGEKCDELWEDFHQKLVDGSLLTLDTYLGQFPDIKTRIAKRSRKLVDYDSARHHLEALQSSKRKDEGRITKAEEEFQKAQKVFEEFNTDLQEELPSLWSRRVGFYVNTFKNVSSLEAKFHKEIALVIQLMHQIVKLISQHDMYVLIIALLLSSDSGPLRIAKTPSPPEEVSPLPSPTASPNHMLAPASPAPARPKSPTQVSGTLAGETDLTDNSVEKISPFRSCLYVRCYFLQVEVLHDFEAANSDELNLKRGDIVLVIPSETTADQEAGWLTGIKESEWLQYRDANSYKGLFPENFTRHLE
uniref:Amphiphysin n=1 Tax=Buteo japonicus TaxID=224669 RepID=A0A8C0AVX3_9AVES